MSRLGGQRPIFERVGGYASTRGPDAVAMFEAYGRRYYGSQAYEMELFFARDEEGRFSAMSIGITKPRQNGKSFAVRDYATWMAAVEGKSVLYSAHEGKTVRKMFKEMADFLESHADFADELDSVYRAGGYEGIYFRNGACIEFQTRTNSGGRGGTYAVIVFDEAQELTSAQQDAVLPTASAAGEVDEGGSDPQMIYVGTVPGPSCQGTVFRELHDRAHSGDSTVWWLEWGARGETLDDVDTDDVDLWYACNPAMGRRMSERTVRNEHDTMSRDGFARERLGWWSPTAGRVDYAVNGSKWAALEVDESPRTWERKAYGVRFTPDGRFVALSICLADGDSAHVEFIREADCAEGTGWLVEWLAERRRDFAAVAIDGKAEAQDLSARLVAAGVPRRAVVVAGPRDAISACGALVSAVNDGRLTHLDDDALTSAATSAVRRRIGDGGGFGFAGEFVERLDSCALALWAARTARRNPNRKLRIG